MNWKETVLSELRIEEIARQRERIKWMEYGKDIAEAQAEASFKAGVLDAQINAAIQEGVIKC